VCPQETRGDIIKKQVGFLKGQYALWFCLFLFMVAGCHYRDDSNISATEGSLIFDRIAVIPFQQIVPEEGRVGAVRCPLCGTTVNAASVPGNPEKVLENLFLDQLKKSKPRFSYLSGERVTGVFRRISMDSLKSPLGKVLRDAGKELGADGVVVGYVYNFRERKGVAYTVEQPASVTFEIHLLRVSDGSLVWRGYFDKTQSSLMEDLFQISWFYRGKGRWITAEELAIEGLEQVMRTFPGL
jgi:hypothetical protein